MDYSRVKLGEKMKAPGDSVTGTVLFVRLRLRFNFFTSMGEHILSAFFLPIASRFSSLYALFHPPKIFPCFGRGIPIIPRRLLPCLCKSLMEISVLEGPGCLHERGL